MEKSGGRQRSRGELQSSRLKRGRRISQQRSWIFPPLQNLAEAFSPSRISTSTQKSAPSTRNLEGLNTRLRVDAPPPTGCLFASGMYHYGMVVGGGGGRSSRNCCSSSETLQIKEQRKQRREDEVILSGQQHTQRQSTSHDWT